jgi:hypothetical protein
MGHCRDKLERILKPMAAKRLKKGAAVLKQKKGLKAPLSIDS